MRYEARAYGSRQEIVQHLTNNLGGHRSERRQREAADAIAMLEGGADEVTFGHCTYVVEDEAASLG